MLNKYRFPFSSQHHHRSKVTSRNHLFLPSHKRWSLVLTNMLLVLLYHWRRDRLPTSIFLSFPCGSAGKESTCSAGDLGFISGLGRSPGEGKGYPLKYSGPENSMDCVVHGVAKSRTQLRDFHFTTVPRFWYSFTPPLTHPVNPKLQLHNLTHPGLKCQYYFTHYWPWGGVNK